MASICASASQRLSRKVGSFSINDLCDSILSAVVYFAAEWFVAEDAKFTLEKIPQQEVRQNLEVESVGIDGWLLSGKRSRISVIILPSGDRVLMEFSMIGNPVTGSTVMIEGEEPVKLKLRDFFRDSF